MKAISTLDEAHLSMYVPKGAECMRAVEHRAFVRCGRRLYVTNTLSIAESDLMMKYAAVSDTVSVICEGQCGQLCLPR